MQKAQKARYQSGRYLLILKIRWQLLRMKKINHNQNVRVANSKILRSAKLFKIRDTASYAAKRLMKKKLI